MHSIESTVLHFSHCYSMHTSKTILPSTPTPTVASNYLPVHPNPPSHHSCTRLLSTHIHYPVQLPPHSPIGACARSHSHSHVHADSESSHRRMDTLSLYPCDVFYMTRTATTAGTGLPISTVYSTLSHIRSTPRMHCKCCCCLFLSPWTIFLCLTSGNLFQWRCCTVVRPALPSKLRGCGV
jgi:hypothetical protein